MSTPEQPDTPPLTRKQLRDIRNTGATPVIDTQDVPDAPVPEPEPAAQPAHLARAAEPVVLPEPPVPDLSVDLGVSPLTRRQARQQERIRTASVPVVTPEVAAAYAAAQAPAAPEALATDAASLPIPSPPASTADESPETLSPFEVLGVAAVVDDPAHVAEPELEAQPEPEPAPVPEPEMPAEHDEPAEPDIFADLTHDEDAPEPAEEPEERAVVHPAFGAALLAGAASDSSLAPSFDELITRSSNGSAATPNALILSQSPDGGPIIAPLTATGEVLITGTLNLPEGLGSLGHAPGAADGKEADAVLVDGELPAHSSPTPIAASAAISTVKTPGEIIKPPTPEKGGRLMMTLAITAGVLALALVGVLILAFATGVFS